MMFVVAVLFALLLLADLPALLRQGDRRELAVYGLLAGLALLYMVCYALGRPVFSPVKEMSELVQGLGLDYSQWQGHS